METSRTLTLSDILGRGLPEGQKGLVLDLLGEFIGGKIQEEKLKAAVEANDRITVQVDRAVEKEVKHLATKDDLKEGLHAMERKLVYWMVGILVTILLGFIVTLAALVPAKSGRTATGHAPGTTQQLGR